MNFRRLLLLLVFSAICFSTFAQYVPQGFNYQAVARDRMGKAIVSSPLVVEITIREGSVLGTIVWQEGHNVVTNDFGLFDLIIGEGVTTGRGTLYSFSHITWGGTQHFLEVRVDFGNGLVYMGNSRFMSVPYALVADSVKNAGVPKYMIFDSIRSIKIETQGFKLPTGASAGAVLMSDAYGNATWNQSGGDVTGPYNNLSVIRIQGRTVTAAAPADGQLLKWSAALNSWVLAADDVNPSLTSGSGITINGTIVNADSNRAIWNADKIQNRAVSTTAPLVGQVLKWNGSEWLPEDDLGGTYTAGDGIDISANTISTKINTASGLQFSGGEIEINAGTTMNTTGGILNANNTQSIWNAGQLVGTNIDALITPANGQVLTWNSTTTQWEALVPSATASTSGTYVTVNGIVINADSTSPIWNANKLYNTDISSTLSPSAGNVLTWNGTTNQWEASVPSATASTSGTYVTVNGIVINADSTKPIWNANQIQSHPVSSVIPGNNQVLLYDSTAGNWVPATMTVAGATTFIGGSGISISETGGVITITNTGDTDASDDITTSTAAGGDLSGFYPNPNVIGLRGYAISSAAPGGGQVLTWNGTTNQWEAAAPITYSAGTGVTITGTTIIANNNDTIWNANRLYGKNLPTIAPAADQMLKFDGTDWIYVNESNYQYNAGTGVTITGTTISANNTSPIWNANQLYGTAVSSSLSPANGEVLTWNSTSSQWEAATATGTTYTAGTGIDIAGTTISANNNDTIWNANRLYGRNLPTIAPAADQMLKFDGTNWTYVNESNYQYTAGTGIAITGNTISALNTDTIWNANQLYGTAVSGTLSPANGEVLTWNSTSSQWEASTPTGTTYTAGTGIDITGTTISANNNDTIWNANRLYGKNLPVTAPVADHMLKFDGTNWTYVDESNYQYTAGTGIDITGNIISANNTDTIWNANQIYGTAVSSGLSPSAGNVLTWNGTTNEWEASAPTGTTYTAGTGITVTGTVISANNNDTIWNANRLYGKSLPTSAPTANQLLRFDGSEWKYIDESNYRYTAGDGIDITGNTINVKILTSSGLTLTAGNFIGINYGSTMKVTVGALGGILDARNTEAMWNASQLQGSNIRSPLSATNGQVLTWNTSNSQWEAADPTGATYTAGTGITISGTTISANNTSPIWNANQLYGTAVSSTLSPAAGNVLTWNGTSNQWEATAPTGVYTAGDGIDITGTTISARILASRGLEFVSGVIGINHGTTLKVTAGKIDADSSRAIWNANKLFGTNISSTLSPAAGNVLTWNGTTNEWEAAAPTGVYTAGNGIDITGTTISARIMTSKGLQFVGGEIGINHGTTLKVTAGVIDADSGRAIWNANKLFGTNISSTLSPAGGNVLTWNGTTNQWEASAPSAYTAGDGIDITGTTISARIATSTGLGFSFGQIGINYGTTMNSAGGVLNANNTNPIWNANRLYNRNLPTGAPANNQMLKYDAVLGEWIYVNESNYQYTAGTGINIAGNVISATNTTAMWNANQLYGTNVSASLSPTAGQVLTWNAVTSQWEAQNGSSNAIAGRGISISSDTIHVNLSANSGLGFNVSNQLEIKPGAGLYLTSGTIAAYHDSALWNARKLLNRNISTTAPADKQLLVYNNTTSEWEPSNITQLADSDGDTRILLEKSANEDRIRFEASGKEVMAIDTNGVGIGTSTPTSTLDVRGSVAFKVDTIHITRINPVTLNDTFYMMVSNNPTVITNHVFMLPKAASCPGRTYLFKSISSGIVRLIPDGTETIDGTSGAYDFSGLNKFRKIISDGKNWLIIGFQ